MYVLSAVAKWLDGNNNNNKNQGVSEYVWYNYRAKAIN
jgi:hypothetical protein